MTQAHKRNIAIAIAKGKLSPAITLSMREWISDCMWTDIEPEAIKELSTFQVLAGVEVHYDGGIQAFLESEQL